MKRFFAMILICALAISTVPVMAEDAAITVSVDGTVIERNGSRRCYSRGWSRWEFCTAAETYRV